MKSNTLLLIREDAYVQAILNEVEKVTSYNELGKKESLQLTLLAEELIGMLPNLVERADGSFWMENEDKAYELHVKLNVKENDLDTRDNFLALSSTGKNAAAKGIVGKIRAAADALMSSFNAPVMLNMDYLDAGMVDYDMFSHSWSLEHYIHSLENSAISEEKKEAWDELEKSVVAKLADDVIVGIRGKRFDIIVKKTF